MGGSIVLQPTSDGRDRFLTAELSGDYAGLVRRLRPEAVRPGEIVNEEGNVLGRHEGYARFTIGQRRGVRIAGGQPMYVIAIDPATILAAAASAKEFPASNTSQCCRLIMGWGMVSPASRLRPIVVGSLSEMVVLLALPPTTVNFASMGPPNSSVPLPGQDFRRWLGGQCSTVSQRSPAGIADGSRLLHACFGLIYPLMVVWRIVESNGQRNRATSNSQGGCIG